MALDTYIIRPVSDRAYKVLRYKAMELMDSRVISQVRENSTDKRERVVHQFIKDKKPDVAVYWLENSKIRSLKLEQGSHLISGIDRIENGKVHVWVAGKKIPVPTPAGMTVGQFEVKLKAMWGHDIGDAQDWLMGMGGFASTLSAYGIDLSTPGAAFVGGDAPFIGTDSDNDRDIDNGDGDAGDGGS